MQYGGQAASSYGSTSAALKRRERSPSPQSNKRQVPPTYSPALYAEAAPGLSRGWSFDASETTGDTPTSQRSSPGLDWLRRTQDLHLETPPLNGAHPLAGPPDQGTTAAGADSNGDVGMDHEQSMNLEPTIAGASTQSVDAAAQPSSILYQPTPVAPHHAPPLHRHLAGSPQQDRQVSRPPTPASGVQSGMAPPSQLGNASFGLAGPVDWSQQPKTLISSSEDADMMDDSPTGPKPSGGWKVTMGYRSDCVKCLQRVPGHYSHVVPT